MCLYLLEYISSYTFANVYVYDQIRIRMSTYTRMRVLMCVRMCVRVK